MRGRILVLISALAVMVLVSNFALKTKREEIKYEVEKKDFSFIDVKHGASVAGGWRGKDYVLTIAVNFPDSKLNMELVLKDKKASGNIDVKPDNYVKPKHGKLDKFHFCAANGTRPINNRTCKPQPLGFMMRLYNTCQSTIVTIKKSAKDGATWAWNGLVNTSMTMIDKGYNEVMFVSSWTWERMIWLINEARETVIWIAEWAWERIQNIVTRMGLWAWDGLAWLAEMILWGASRLGAGLCDVGAWFGNGIAALYAGYLKDHLTNLKAWFAGLTWRDVNRFVIAVCVDYVCIKLLTRAERAYRRGKLDRQAQLAREAAARAAAAERRRKRSAIENLKNRHKKKQF